MNKLGTQMIFTQQG